MRTRFLVATSAVVWKGRVFLEKYYSFTLVTPLEGEWEQSYEGSRKLEEGREGSRKLDKVRQSSRNFEKVRESSRKLEEVGVRRPDLP